MCFAPQRRGLFQHLNFQKWSDVGVLCTFGIGNVLRATAAYIFFDISTSKSAPKLKFFVHFLHRNVLRATKACNFSSLIWPDGSAPAALASLLFDHPEPHIIGKNALNCDFPTFSHMCIFFLITLSVLCSSHFLASPLLTLPTSAFPSVHTVGSLACKHPSINHQESSICQLFAAYLAFFRKVKGFAENWKPPCRCARSFHGGSFCLCWGKLLRTSTVKHNRQGWD